MKKFLFLMVALVFVQACSSGGGGSSSGGGSSTGGGGTSGTDGGSSTGGGGTTGTDGVVPGTKGFASIPIKLSNTSNTPGDFDFAWGNYASANDETLLIYNDSNRSLYESSDLGVTWEKSFTLPTAAPTSGSDKVHLWATENKFFVIDKNLIPNVVYMRSGKNKWDQVLNARLLDIIPNHAVSAEEKSSGDSLKGPFFYSTWLQQVERAPLASANTDFNTPEARFKSLDGPSINFARVDGKMYLLGRFDPGHPSVLYGSANDTAFKDLEIPNHSGQARYLARGKGIDILTFSQSTTAMSSWREKSLPFFYWASSSAPEARKKADWFGVGPLNRDYQKLEYSLIGFQYLSNRFILVLNKFENSKYSCVVVTSTDLAVWEEKKPADADCRALYFVKETPVIAAVKNAGPDKGKLFFLTAKSF